ncbi:unnamed protein product [Effrenium voratum]|nr:unnamed protein product [Effrenium voratum]
MALILAVLALPAVACAFAAKCTSCSKPHLLLQVGRRQDVDSYPSWVAEAFEECLLVDVPYLQRQKQRAFQHRVVLCRSADDGRELPETACDAGAKPRSWRRCDCGVVVCREGPIRPPEQQQLAVGSFRGGGAFETIGCLAGPDEPSTEGSGADLPRDMACVGWTSVAPCRRGLPFYRFTESALRPGGCFRLCTGKGLDLFGLSDGGECRCGASLLNRQAWRWRKPPPGLALAWPRSRRVRPELCDTRVYRYTGHFEEGGALPTPLTSLTQEDLAYVDSIATGRHIYPEEEEDVSRRLEAVVQPGTEVALLSAAKNDCPVTVSCPCTHPDYACYAWYEAGARCACFMINSHTTAENCAQFGGTFCGQADAEADGLGTCLPDLGPKVP